jgi:hypothetical protein
MKPADHEREKARIEKLRKVIAGMPEKDAKRLREACKKHGLLPGDGKG